MGCSSDQAGLFDEMEVESTDEAELNAFGAVDSETEQATETENQKQIRSQAPFKRT